MLLSPVEQGEFELCQAAAQCWIVATLAHLLCHVLAYSVDAWVVLVLLVGNEQVELRVLLNLHTKFVESLDRSVAGEEVLWTWTKGDDLKTLQTEDDACYRHEVSHHLSHFLGCADTLEYIPSDGACQGCMSS